MSTVSISLLLIVLISCGLPQLIRTHYVQPACPPEAPVCEFYLELAETWTMTRILRDRGGARQVLEFGKNGDVYALDGCGNRTLLDNDADLSDVPFGDGGYKKVLLYNGSLPGPPIIVYEGQQVMVRLWNRLRSQGTTLHFHGIKQLNTPWMDGVAGVSQCDILPGERFTYRFLASPVGTHWYHSHYGAQRSMGAAGAIVVLERPDTALKNKPSRPEFNKDFYLVVQDWYRETTEDIFAIIAYDTVKYPFNYNTDSCYNSTKQYDLVDSGVLPFVSALINGRGRYMGHDQRYPDKTYVPREVFEVKKDTFIRFRVIGASMMFPMRVSVDEHRIHVIASDGHYLRPQAMDSIIIYNGERYDFYIEATDPLNVGNYWIRVQTLEITQNGKPIEPHGERAILRYEGAPIRDPHTEHKSCTDKDPCHVYNCPYTSEVTWQAKTLCHPVTDLVLEDPIPTLEPEPGEELEEYFLNFHFAMPGPGVTEKPTINGVQHMHAVASPMTYPGAFDSGIKRCFFQSCPTGLCRKCQHHLHLPFNKTIQLNFVVTVNNAPGVINGNDHPVHIHGNSLQILKVSYPFYHPVTKAYNKTSTHFRCTEENCNTIEWSNKSWEGGNVPHLKRQGAPVKDSFVVPVGGYLITRFRTDNPGYWFMHCHVEFHNAEGMGLVLKVGEESEMNAKPKGMRTCGNFKFKNDNTNSTMPVRTKASDDLQACANADNAFRTPALVLGASAIFLTFSGIYLTCTNRLRSPTSQY